jgi:hypothetical protein
MNENERLQPSELISAGMKKYLNSHGHGFHYAVIKKISELTTGPFYGLHPSLEAIEFPVTAGGKNTHIDFLVEVDRRYGGGLRRTYIVAECKRTLENFKTWSFVRGSYREEQVVFERFSDSGGIVNGENPVRLRVDQAPFHIGFELKNGQHSSEGPNSSDREAINDAVTQVLRGTSGLINHLFRSASWPSREIQLFTFVPVIFTTAKLWVSEVALSETDIGSGNVADLNCEQRSWIWFNYNRPSTIRHDLSWIESECDVSVALARLFTRTVAIVTPDGMDRFFSETAHGPLANE